MLRQSSSDYHLFGCMSCCICKKQQECIPVGCVPLAGGGGVCLSVCWDTPGLGLDTPWVWAWTPPSQTPHLPLGLGLDTPWLDPPTSPLGLGLDPPPPPDRPPTSPLGLGLDVPPWTEFLTHASENITLPQLCCWQ